jgi:hypothetical protein
MNRANRVEMIASSNRAEISHIKTARLELSPRKNPAVSWAGSKAFSAPSPRRVRAPAPVQAAALILDGITTSVTAVIAVVAVGAAKAAADIAAKTVAPATSRASKAVLNLMVVKTAVSRVVKASTVASAVGVAEAAAGVIAAKAAAVVAETIAVHARKASKAAAQFERSVNYTTSSR